MFYTGRGAYNGEKSQEKKINYNQMNDESFTQLWLDQTVIYNRGFLEFQTYVEEQTKWS